MNIPKEFIDQLLARVDIVEIIDERVPLKKTGGNYTARCPFHDEKTPSFTVSPSKQFYHCFGCSASGDAIEFLREISSFSFEEAVEELANTVGLQMPKGDGFRPQKHETENLLQTLADANEWFKAQLRHHPQANQAVTYLKKRNVSGQMAAYFELGFAPTGWDNLAKTAKDNKETLNLMEKAGLLSVHQTRGYYDRFRSRIIFPIHDRRGRVIGFGGRILGEDKPKYLNSPETPVFHKGSELYNLHRARADIGQQNYVLVVEGYTDVVSLTQRSIKNSVATLGTATTSNHLKMLFRLTPHVIFCFDGDPAGRQAAWKALEAVLPEMVSGHQTSFLFLPDGEDPDSVVQKSGSEAFVSMVRNSTAISDFFYDTLLKEIDINRLDGRARLAETAQPLLAKIPSGPFRELMQDKLQLLSGLRNVRTQKKQLKLTQKRPDERLSPTATAISILMQNPFIACDMSLPTLSETNEMVPDVGLQLLTEIYEIAKNNPDITGPAMLERFRERDTFRFLKKLAIKEHFVGSDNLKAFFEETILAIEEQNLNSAINEILQRSTIEKLDRDQKVQLSDLYNRREKLRMKRGSQ
ncbi:MAG: DNA primase [Acidiferrobacteraceae bacterium]|nr:DNA primase [Acidiferrobacteraceae bacterium]